MIVLDYIFGAILVIAGASVGLTVFAAIFGAMAVPAYLALTDPTVGIVGKFIGCAMTGVMYSVVYFAIRAQHLDRNF
jgi:hypothetical protein